MKFNYKCLVGFLLTLTIFGLGGCKINLTEVPFPKSHRHYLAIDLEQLGKSNPLLTSNPMALAKTLFKDRERVEGRSHESFETLETDGTSQVIGITKIGLADDSMAAIRYRLEFVVEGNQWRLAWGGKQFSCHEGRGGQSWDKELCN